MLYDPGATIIYFDYVGPQEKPLHEIVVGDRENSLKAFSDSYIFSDGLFHFVDGGVLPRRKIEAFYSDVVEMAGLDKSTDGYNALRVVSVRAGALRTVTFGSKSGLMLLERLAQTCRGDPRKGCHDIVRFRSDVDDYLRRYS